MTKKEEKEYIVRFASTGKFYLYKIPQEIKTCFALLKKKAICSHWKVLKNLTVCILFWAERWPQ